ncbi:aldehyde dehydrogenase family protein [Burkholderia cepacia]|uniref:aldehyde dehydrogenase family protein n=1 Tax=Burkholderia cepacia TaxID=292 RepID=UPI0004D85BD9|nr:aldehyde dehydrogenase family protein [Burkholderia cepacia]KEX94180.1 aldehyde dehydrogenase [Pseudomonas putida]MDN7438324.1 aldehyde dehydrogenase family protein [Burkholderia cepacia]
MLTLNQTASNHAPDSHYGHFIDNQWVEGESGETIDSFNPANGAFLTKIPRGTAGDVDRAVQAAARAFKTWGKASPAERANALLKIADLLEADAERFVAFESMDVGKPIREARVDVPLAIDHFRYFAGAIRSHSDEASMLDHQTMSLTLSEPLGVVGQVIPWNFPLLMAAWKIAPAIAMGNTVVIKPSEMTPVTILELAKIFAKVLPAGVVNVVTGLGTEVGQAILDHPQVAKLAFTGSTRVGEGVAAAAAKRIIPATLELGGKSANIIFPDANWDRAVEAAALGILWNQGEVCESGSRLFVHESIYERFVGELKERFEKVRVGNPLDPNTQMGAQVSQIQTDRIMGYIELAKEEGARILTGGERLTGGEYDAGFFIKPTIIVDVRNDMRVAQEEIFGPVVTVLPFKDEDEVVALANASDYGLAGAVWTQDINRAIRVARAIETGRMWVNTYHDIPAHAPFGGYKKSGLGRETHKSMLDAYSQKKNIYISLNEAPFGVF